MSTVSAPAFGVLLRRFRQAAGFTQEGLAERAGLSPEGISALERGVNRSPRKDTIALLADALALGAAERALLEAAARKRTTSSPPGLHPPRAMGEEPAPLVGREHELARVVEHLSSNGPAALLITGEPGIGKSRLLKEAADRAVAAGWNVLWGGCRRRGSQEPFAPLLGVLEQYCARRSPAQLRTELAGCEWIVRLLPELAPVVAAPAAGWTLPLEQERRLMFAAVSRLLGTLAGPAGTLLVLDDLQWAESDGLDLLASLLHASTDAPIRLLGAYRDTELPTRSPLVATVADLAHEGLVAQLPLAPLDSQASAALLYALLDAPSVDGQALADEIGARAGGVPFFLVSSVQAVRAGAAETVPWNIAQSIRQRVAALPEIAQEALGIAAIIGQRSSRTLLTAIALRRGGDEEQLVGAIEAACKARLLVEAGEDAYAFANDLIREVIARELGAARRAAVHRRVAEALEAQAGAPPVDELAYHYSHAGAPEKAATYFERAGMRAAGMGAHASAEGYFAALVDRREALGQALAAAQAREWLGAARTALAQYDRALVDLEAAAQAYGSAGDGESAARVAVLIGQVHADHGTAAEGAARLRPVLAAAEAQQYSPRVRAALNDMLAQLLHLAGHYTEQLTVAERAAELARVADDAPLLAQVEMRRGNALRMLGRMTEAAHVLEDIVRLAEEAGEARTLAFALDNVSVVYLLRGELERSDQCVERALALAERLGDPLVLQLMLVRRGVNAFGLGAWERAQRCFERAAEMMHQVGESWVAAYTSLGLGQLRLARGEIATATPALAESIQLAERIGDLQALRWAQCAAAELDLLEGRPSAARDRLVPLLDRPGQQEGLVTYLLPYLAWAELDGGDQERAAQTLAASLERARSEDIRLALVDALRVRALFALQERDWSAVASALDEGLALSQAMRYPYAEAKLLYTYGMVYAQQGAPEAARERLRAASAVLDALGERLYQTRVTRALAGLPRA